MTDDDIREIATLFRTALDHVDPALWRSVTVDQFPHGACGHAAELLGRYLRDTIGIETLLKIFAIPMGLGGAATRGSIMTVSSSTSPAINLAGRE